MKALLAELALLVCVAGVLGLNGDLQRHSVIYGISSLVSDNGTECYRHLAEFFESVEKKHVWALKVLDASGQPGSGFLVGNNLWRGLHSQCGDISNRKPLEINHDQIPHAVPTENDYPPFDIKFVMAHLRHNNTLQQHVQLPLEHTIQLGLCVPESCSSDELQSLIRQYLDKRYLEAQNLYELDLELTKLRILKEDVLWLLSEPCTIAFVTIVGIIGILVIIGTFLDEKQSMRMENIITGISNIQDLASKPENGLSVTATNTKSITFEKTESHFLTQLVKCFSARKNVLLLVGVKIPSDSVAMIHGVRTFGMLWVIMVHAVFYQSDFIMNPAYPFRLSESFFNQILSNSTYCVDTYLFVSGFLVSYMFYKSKKDQLGSNKPANYSAKLSEYFTMFINRYFRLTPTYVIVMLGATVAFTYYRQTSAAYANEQLEDNCSKYWWRNLLYINNLYPRSEMCLSWSWYLSLDTQCFAVSTFLLILSTIWFKVAASLLIGVIFLCVGLTAYKSYSISYIPTMDEQLVQLDAIYDLPWNRMGPYLVGVITGYILVVKLQKKLELKKGTLAFLWTVFPLLNLWILFTLYTRQLSVGFSSFYMGTSRTLWGVGLAWLMIACCTNNGGLINEFLSFRGWVPLSRLTYCCYLLNPVISYTFSLGSENMFHGNTQGITMSAYGVLFATFFYSFFASLFFETPFIRLTKLLLNKLTKRKASAGTNPA